jgi:hypothetical protein
LSEQTRDDDQRRADLRERFVEALAARLGAHTRG